MFKLETPDIRQIFPSQVFMQGLGYWIQKHVLTLAYGEYVDKPGVFINATVHGSNNQVYQTHITASLDQRGRLQVQSQCSCSVGSQCKHVVAVLLSLSDKLKKGFPATLGVADYSAETAPPVYGVRDDNPFAATEPTLEHSHQQTKPTPIQTKSPTIATKLSGKIQLWLEKIEKANQVGQYPNNVSQRVLYLLDCQEDEDDGKLILTVRTVVAKLFKNGDYSGQYRDISRPTQARYFLDLDKQLFSRLTYADLNRSQYLFRPTELYCLRGLEAADILRALILSQRCHWQNPDNPPLSLGSPLKVEPTWQIMDDGNQELCFVAESSPTQAKQCILPTQPLWYVDVETWQCGSVDTGLPDALSLTLLEAPPLPPEQVALVQEKLSHNNILPDTLQPQGFTRIQSCSITPKIRLQLFNAEFKHAPVYASYMGEIIRLPLARLTFIYGEHEINVFDDNNDALCHYDTDNQILLKIDRWNKEEKQAAKRLKKWFFMGLVQVFHARYLQIHEENLFDLILMADPHSNFNDAEAERKLTDFSIYEVPKLRAAGWQVDISDDYLYRVIEPNLLDDWYAEVEEGSGIDWFGLELGIQVGREKINLMPLLVELVKKLNSLDELAALADMPDNSLVTVRLPDQRLLPLPIGRIRGILNTLVELLEDAPLDDDGRLQMSTLKAAQLAELEAAMGAAQLRWLGGEQLLELGRKLRDFQGVQPVPVPENLQATLRPYQQTGLNWLQFLREYRLGGILADDMGLGKTVQTLTHLLVEKNAGRLTKPCLVIAPTSLMSNWRVEAERFTPMLSVLVLQGDDRHTGFERINEHDIVLTTYPLLPRDKETLLQHQYYQLILDEAQNIKNPKAKATQIVHQLQAEHRLCLTGTPMENHLGELWSMFHFLLPGLLGDPLSFRHLFRTPIERDQDTDRRNALHRRIKPFMLRRTKENVVAELPEKTEIVRSIELNGAQRDLYETIRLTMNEKVRKEIADKGLARSQIIILDALLKLRQVCCDPRLLKMSAAENVTESAKLQALMDMLPEMIEEGQRILLFSQFTSMLSLIETELKQRNISYSKLTGQTRKRAEAIELFQSGTVPLFLISLKAGGVGLNLTAADTVIHYDPWWNPAVEQQATDRAHRIGQTKKVFVYKLISAGTVEEKIQELQMRKQQLADAMLDGKADVGSQLSQQDLEALFEPLV